MPLYIHTHTHTHAQIESQGHTNKTNTYNIIDKTSDTRVIEIINNTKLTQSTHWNINCSERSSGLTGGSKDGMLRNVFLKHGGMCLNAT